MIKWNLFWECKVGKIFTNHKWVLYFIECIFCIYYYDHVIFIFYFVYITNHVYWLANIVSPLHPPNKSHLIMVYNIFNVLLYVVCQYFVEDFSIYVPQQYLPEVFFVVSLSGFEIKVMLASKKEFGSHPSFWIFSNSL